MQFKRLTINDLDFQLKQEKEIVPEWFVPHISDLIEYNPDGCFAMENRGRIVGVVTTTLYKDHAWMGWLYVDLRDRKLGLGERLMRHGIEYINSKKKYSITIEAVREAVTLYERIGFQKQFETHHFILKQSDFKQSAKNSNINIVEFEDSLLEDVATFDEHYFHQNRLRLFEIIKRNINFSGYVALKDSKVVGFIFLNEARRNQNVMPMVIDLTLPESEEIASALIENAFQKNSKQLYFRTPSLKTHYYDFLMKLGAQPTGYFTYRMFLGREYSIESQGILSLGCPGKG